MESMTMYGMEGDERQSVLDVYISDAMRMGLMKAKRAELH